LDRETLRTLEPPPALFQKAELIETACHCAQIVFRDAIPCGKYTFVAATRCIEGKDLQALPHPVRAA